MTLTHLEDKVQISPQVFKTYSSSLLHNNRGVAVSSFILTLPSTSLCMSNLSPSHAEFTFKCLVCLDASFYCHIHLLSGPFNGFLTGLLGPHYWSHCVVLCKMQIWPLPHSSVTLPVALSMKMSPHLGSGSTLSISGPLSTPLPSAPWAPPCFQAFFHQGLCTRCSLSA